MKSSNKARKSRQRDCVFFLLSSAYENENEEVLVLILIVLYYVVVVTIDVVFVDNVVWRPWTWTMVKDFE